MDGAVWKGQTPDKNSKRLWISKTGLCLSAGYTWSCWFALGKAPVTAKGNNAPSLYCGWNTVRELRLQLRLLIWWHRRSKNNWNHLFCILSLLSYWTHLHPHYQTLLEYNCFNDRYILCKIHNDSNSQRIWFSECWLALGHWNGFIVSARLLSSHDLCISSNTFAGISDRSWVHFLLVTNCDVWNNCNNLHPEAWQSSLCLFYSLNYNAIMLMETPDLKHSHMSTLTSHLFCWFIWRTSFHHHVVPFCVSLTRSWQPTAAHKSNCDFQAELHYSEPKLFKAEKLLQ